MKTISFAEETFLLRPAGTMLWSKAGILVASDLHLEKGSSYLARGFAVPPYDTKDTLRRLAAEVAATMPRRLILLGDSFHDDAGYGRLNDDDRQLLDAIIAGQETIWIAGNHDEVFVHPLAAKHIDYAHPPVLFRHQAGRDDSFEISGHYHPSAKIVHRGHKVGGRCFLVTTKRIVMPSFGSYTGGFDIFDPAMRGIRGDEFEVHICGVSKVFSLRSDDFSQTG